MTTDDTIFYDAEGTPYYVDFATKSVRPLKNDIKGAMKNANGRWNKAIREKAKAMFLQDHSANEISAETRVPKSTIIKWIYGQNGDKSEKNCFYNIRQRRVDELLEQNKATVVAVNKGLLNKMKDYANDEKVYITNANELKSYAESFTKLNLVDGKDTNAQQTNIYLQPYSPEESKEIIESDPVLLAEDVDDEESSR